MTPRGTERHVLLEDAADRDSGVRLEAAADTGRLTFAFACDRCGDVHRVPLDEDWAWQGTLACGRWARLEVDLAGRVH